jgi:heterodisulfide reductase subunit B
MSRMPRTEVLEKVPVSDKYFLFRSCVSSSKYPGIETSTEEVFRKIGVELEESEEQSCCGGFITFTSVAEVTSTMPAVARNLSIPEEQGMDTLTMCNGCHTFLTEFGHFMDHNPPIKDKVNEMLGMIGREYKGETKVLHMIEVLYKLKDRLAEHITRPLKGLRLATHYGCHYLYGFKKDAVDDPFTPTVLEELIDITGAEAVDYPEARTCCGSGLTQVIIHKEEMSLPFIKKKLDSLNEAEVDALIVVCPYCMTILDRSQFKMEERGIDTYGVPVLYINQLLGLAMGIDPVRLGLEAHVTSANGLLAKLEASDA